MRVLEARLLKRELERHAEEQAKIKGEHVSAGWSNQIRSYVLHPYKMVKGHPQRLETSNAAAVLEGDLDAVMQGVFEVTRRARAWRFSGCDYPRGTERMLHSTRSRRLTLEAGDDRNRGASARSRSRSRSA